MISLELLQAKGLSDKWGRDNQCFEMGSIDAICDIAFQCQLGRRNPIALKGRTWLHNFSKKTFGWTMISKAAQISLIPNICKFSIRLCNLGCNLPKSCSKLRIYNRRSTILEVATTNYVESCIDQYVPQSWGHTRHEFATLEPALQNKLTNWV